MQRNAIEAEEKKLFKICSQCKKEKSVHDFHANQYACKPCRKKYRKLLESGETARPIRAALKAALSFAAKEQGIEEIALLKYITKNRNTIRVSAGNLPLEKAALINLKLIDKVLSEKLKQDLKIKVEGRCLDVFDDKITYQSCATCREIKHENFFQKRTDRTDLFRSYCTQCYKEALDRPWNMNYSLESDPWERKLALTFDNCSRRYQKAKSQYPGKPEDELSRYKCYITLGDLKKLERPEICPIAKIPIWYKICEPHCPNSASLDRIDNELPYQVGNLQWLSLRGNTLKGDKLTDLTSYIRNRYKNVKDYEKLKESLDKMYY